MSRKPTVRLFPVHAHLLADTFQEFPCFWRRSDRGYMESMKQSLRKKKAGEKLVAQLLAAEEDAHSKGLIRGEKVFNGIYKRNADNTVEVLVRRLKGISEKLQTMLQEKEKHPNKEPNPGKVVGPLDPWLPKIESWLKETMAHKNYGMGPRRGEDLAIQTAPTSPPVRPTAPAPKVIKIGNSNKRPQKTAATKPKVEKIKAEEIKVAKKTLLTSFASDASSDYIALDDTSSTDVIFPKSPLAKSTPKSTDGKAAATAPVTASPSTPTRSKRSHGIHNIIHIVYGQ